MNTEKLIKDLMHKAEHCKDVAELQAIADKLEEYGAYQHASWVRTKAARHADEWTRMR